MRVFTVHPPKLFILPAFHYVPWARDNLGLLKEELPLA